MRLLAIFSNDQLKPRMFDSQTQRLAHGLSGSCRGISGSFGFDGECCTHTSHTIFSMSLDIPGQYITSLDLLLHFTIPKWELCIRFNISVLTTLGCSTCDFQIKVHQLTRHIRKAEYITFSPLRIMSLCNFHLESGHP